MIREGNPEFRPGVRVESGPLPYDGRSAAEFVDAIAGPEGGFADGADNTQLRWLVGMMVMPKLGELSDPRTRESMKQLHARLGAAWRFGEED